MNITMETVANFTPAQRLEPAEVTTYIGAAIMIVFLALGLLGNMLIMLAIISNRRVWNVINTFIISLAFNDLLTYFLVVVSIIASYVAHGWSAGDVMCALNPELTVLFTGCSLWHTALIAIHRYVVVCHNHVYSRMSKEAYVVFVLVMARAIPMACVFPGFSLQSSAYAPRMLRCILLPSQSVRLIYVTLLLIILPCLIVVACYAFVFGFVWRIARQVHTRNSILRREVQITKMFGVVFFMILLGFVPYAVIRNVDSDNSMGAEVYVVVTVVYAIASCSNPLVYGAMSTEIRRACAAALQKLLECLHADACCACAKVSQAGAARSSVVGGGAGGAAYSEATSCIISRNALTHHHHTHPARRASPSSSSSGAADTCQKFTFCTTITDTNGSEVTDPGLNGSAHSDMQLNGKAYLTDDVTKCGDVIHGDVTVVENYAVDTGDDVTTGGITKSDSAVMFETSKGDVML